MHDGALEPNRTSLGENLPRRTGRSSRRRSRWGLLLLALALCGCASAAKRFEQGAELESEGRYADAAQRYIQALRKDPGMVQARERLIAVAPLLIRQYMEDGEQFRALGSDVQGANRYLWIDQLVRDAAGVGVFRSSCLRTIQAVDDGPSTLPSMH